MRRGFSSMAVDHRKDVISLRRRAANELRDAKDYLDKGNCVVGQLALHMSLMYEGAAQEAHKGATGEPLPPPAGFIAKVGSLMSRWCACQQRKHR